MADTYGEDWDEFKFMPGLSFSQNVTDAVQEMRAAFIEVSRPLVHRLENWREMVEEIKDANEQIVTLLTYAPDRKIPEELYARLRGLLGPFLLELVEAYEYVCMESERSADATLDEGITELRRLLQKDVEAIRMRQHVVGEFFSMPRPHTDN